MGRLFGLFLCWAQNRLAWAQNRLARALSRPAWTPPQAANSRMGPTVPYVRTHALPGADGCPFRFFFYFCVYKHTHTYIRDTTLQCTVRHVVCVCCLYVSVALLCTNLTLNQPRCNVLFATLFAYVVCMFLWPYYVHHRQVQCFTTSELLRTFVHSDIRTQ